MTVPGKGSDYDSFAFFILITILTDQNKQYYKKIQVGLKSPDWNCIMITKILQNTCLDYGSQFNLKSTFNIFQYSLNIEKVPCQAKYPVLTKTSHFIIKH